MAENRETAILDVQLDAGKVAQDLSDLLAKIDGLKQRQRELNKEIKAGNDVNGQYAAELINVKEAIRANEAQAKGLSAATRLLAADTKTYGDTLNEERRKLADMQRAFDALDKTERESEGGKVFLDAIRQQHDAVLALEEATGRSQRNVGNYPKAWQAAVPGLGKAQAMLGTLGTSLDEVGAKGVGAFKAAGTAAVSFGKTLLVPPIAVVTVILSAIVAVAMKLAEAFRKNDDAMTNLQVVASRLQPLFDALNKVFEVLAVVISQAIVNMTQFITVIGSLIPAYAEAAEASAQLVLAIDALQERERQYAVESARRSRDVAKLREEAMSTTDLDQRRKLLQEAIDLERQNLQDELDIKREQLRIMEETARKEADTTDETKDKIARARAAMYEAETAYYTGVRRLEKELLSVEQQRQQQADKAAEEARKRREEAIKRREAELAAEMELRRRQSEAEADIEKQLADMAVSVIADETERAIAMRQLQGDREIAELQHRLETEQELTAEAKDKLAELIRWKQEALDDEIRRMTVDAADRLAETEMEAEAERQERMLAYRLELAEKWSEEELDLKKQQLELEMQQLLDNEELTDEERLLIRETFAQRAAELDDQMLAHTDEAKKRYQDTLRQTASAASSAFGAMSKAMADFGKSSKGASELAKAFGMMQLIVDQAVSISNTARAITEAVAGATAAAAASGPAAPFVLASYIASMTGAVLSAVAGVVSSIQQARQMMSETDVAAATGGIVPGRYDARDSVRASLSGGEMVLNPAQQRELFDLANGHGLPGFDYEQLAATLTAAVAAMPAPVMAYSEFRDFQQRVATYDEIAAI